MENALFYTAGHSDALHHTIRYLQCVGYQFSSVPTQDVTHLLLPVPSLMPDGTIRGGGNLNQLLSSLPANVHIIGGNLPELHKYTDLLKIPAYEAENAYITAHCAIQLILNQLPRTLRGCKILVIGWGRIGKCLASLLKNLEASVTVAARKESDRAMINALGYNAKDTFYLTDSDYQAILNTVPHPLLKSENSECLKIDLASSPGILGEDVIIARGLPGKMAPESSGELIAHTILQYVL